MRAARALVAFALLVPLAGCGYRSRYPEGRDAAVRSHLPKTFIEMLEGADRLELVALDEPKAFPVHMKTSGRSGVRAAFDVISQVDRERLIRAF